jgi:hypothetical protein
MRVLTDPRTSARWIGVLFMIGSFCFAIASVPGIAAAVPASAVGATYFTGSIFFTSAASLVVLTTEAGNVLRSRDWWAAVIQLAGTIWFNINTFNALTAGMSAHQANLRVWTPDTIGSICFLVSSELSLISVCRRPWCICRGSDEWTIAMLNLVGSVFFGLSAIAAFTLPSTDELLDASLANTGTLLGALCFFWGARLLLPHRLHREVAPVVSD